MTPDVTAHADPNANGRIGGGEPAIPGATVTVYAYSAGELDSVTDGQDGTASKAGITPAGFLAQVAVPEGYAAATSPAGPSSGTAGALTAFGPCPDPPSPWMSAWRLPSDAGAGARGERRARRRCPDPGSPTSGPKAPGATRPALEQPEWPAQAA